MKSVDMCGEFWYVMPKPDGERILVITKNKRTFCRDKNGKLLKKCSTRIPNG
jgi:hypothetical protein